MVENIEAAPEAGDDRNEPALSARNLTPGDSKDLEAVKNLSNAGKDDTLRAFDSEDGFTLTGVEESGLTYVDESQEKPDNPADLLKSLEAVGKLGKRGADIEKNADGTLKSLQIRDLDGFSKFEFSEQGVKRITVDGATRTETKFDSNGDPLSAKQFRAGEREGKSVPVHPEDKIQILVEGDNIVLQSFDKEGDTTIRLDKEGNVLDRSKSTDDQDIWTEYNQDGSMKSHSLTQYDADENVVKRFTENENNTVVDFYDPEGNWEKSVTRGDDFVQTYSIGEDGSQRTLVEKADGTATLTVVQKDGTRSIGESKPGVNSLITINKDGSSIRLTETDKHLTQTVADKNGYWIQNRRDKDSGVSKMTHGDANGPYKGEVTNYDI